MIRLARTPANLHLSFLDILFLVPPCFRGTSFLVPLRFGVPPGHPYFWSPLVFGVS